MPRQTTLVSLLFVVSIQEHRIRFDQVRHIDMSKGLKFVHGSADDAGVGEDTGAEPIHPQPIRLLQPIPLHRHEHQPQ